MSANYRVTTEHAIKDRQDLESILNAADEDTGYEWEIVGITAATWLVPGSLLVVWKRKDPLSLPTSYELKVPDPHKADTFRTVDAYGVPPEAGKGKVTP